MEPARVLIIGKLRAPALEKHYCVFYAASGKQALASLDHYRPELIVIDAVSMRTPGERLSRQLRQRLPEVLLVHLHSGTAAAAADLGLSAPITPRRLHNAIQKLFKAKPREDVIVCGPFAMNVSRRLLTADGLEIQLTPRCTSLMEIFMRAPGQVHDRRELMEKVWQTDYMGDTRTLDVHIRWIREAIEQDSSHPRYLKTVRGVGYRLEIGADVPHVNGNGKKR